MTGNKQQDVVAGYRQARAGQGSAGHDTDTACACLVLRLWVVQGMPCASAVVAWPALSHPLSLYAEPGNQLELPGGLSGVLPGGPAYDTSLGDLFYLALTMTPGHNP